MKAVLVDSGFLVALAIARDPRHQPAKETGCGAILTVDLRDFGVYRIKGNKRFKVVKWFP